MANKGNVSTGEKRFHYIEYQPHLSLLGNEDLASICQAGTPPQDESSSTEHRVKLNEALDMVVRNTILGMTPEKRAKVPETLTGYLEWMEHYVETLPPPTYAAFKGEDLGLMLQQAEESQPSPAAALVIARHMESILLGEEDPLALVSGVKGPEGGASTPADLASADSSARLFDGRFKKLVGLATHERPSMRLIEIGAGTGSVTRHILSTLGEVENKRGGSRFAEYTYTDKLSKNFDASRAEFSAFENRLVFKCLDVEKPPAEQGFEPATYDLVITSNVLHASANLDHAVANLRSLLRPGGHIIVVEPAAPESLPLNVVRGCLAEWWRCRGEGRRWSAAVTEEQWDRVLRDGGFVGNRIVLRDYENEACHEMSVVFSTLAEEAAPDANTRVGTVWVVVPDERSEGDDFFVKHITDSIAPWQTKVLPLAQVIDTTFSDDDIVLSLLEAHVPFLARLTEPRFKALQHIVCSSARRVLWIMFTQPTDAEYPHFSVMQGFFRSVRAEQPDKQIVTLGVDDPFDFVRQLGNIRDVFVASFEKGSRELEYLVWESSLKTGRLVEEPVLNGVLKERLAAQEVSSWRLDPNASYIVPGGFNALGRSVLSWLANKGAKHIIVPSTLEETAVQTAVDTIEDFRQRGIDLATPTCDLADADSCSTMLQDSSKTMPPVKGCIHAASVFQNAGFGKMTFAQWESTTRSTIEAPWNLHRQLPADLDFFVLLPSLAGVRSQVGQSPLAAGCTFQEALARFRVVGGQRGVALDVGQFGHDGGQSQGLVDFGEEDLFALLDVYCDPGRKVVDPYESQVLVDAVRPDDDTVQMRTRSSLFATVSQVAESR